MNQKADFMVHAIAAIILALIVFVPACVYGSKLLGRLSQSDQAEQSVHALAREIREMSLAREGEIRSGVLIVDPESALFYFSPAMTGARSTIWLGDPVPECIAPKGFGTHARTALRKCFSRNFCDELDFEHFSYPLTECGGKQCLVLCQGVTKSEPRELETNVRCLPTFYDLYDIQLSCESLIVEPLEASVSLNMQESIYRKKTDPKRYALELVKEQNSVTVTIQQ